MNVKNVCDSNKHAGKDRKTLYTSFWVCFTLSFSRNKPLFFPI